VSLEIPLLLFGNELEKNIFLCIGAAFQVNMLLARCNLHWKLVALLLIPATPKN
jgi:hypothetical protein